MNPFLRSVPLVPASGGTLLAGRIIVFTENATAFGSQRSKLPLKIETETFNDVGAPVGQGWPYLRGRRGCRGKERRRARGPRCSPYQDLFASLLGGEVGWVWASGLRGCLSLRYSRRANPVSLGPSR
ncbi:hypothetical protein ANTQUA_LOCUS4124 [Anthophora quadrimaculata]